MLTIDQGLSQNYIYSVLQDRKGFLWIGTKDGLNRYDGYKFICFRHEPGNLKSLSENNVSVIFEDSRSRLWVGTNGGGLNLFDKASEAFHHFERGKTKYSLSSNFITCIFEGRNGDIWIGSTDGGLCKMSAQTLAVTRIAAPTDNKSSSEINHIHAICETNDGLLWLGTAKAGLNCYDPLTGKWMSLSSLLKTKSAFKLPDEVTAIHSKETSVWFGGPEGLYLFDRNENTIAHYPIFDKNGRPCPINNITENGRSLFISSFNLFAEFDLQSKKHSVVFEPTGKWFTNAVCTDRSGIFWLGTGGWGLMKYNPHTKMFNAKTGVFLYETQPQAVKVLHENKRLNDPNLLDGRGTEFLSIIRRSNGECLIATPRSGLIRADESGRLIEILRTNPKGAAAKPVWAVSDVFEDINKTIWIATVGGLSRYDAADRKFTYFPVYAGRQNAPEFLNKSGGAGYPDITAHLIDNENIFWLGTPDRGIFRFDPNSGSVTNYRQENNANSLSSDNVLCIAQDERNSAYLWIGTEGGGLNHFEKKTGVCEQITTRNGLPNNVVYGILTDNANNLWMSTNKGICCFDPSLKVFRVYDVESGLQSNEFNRREYYKAPDGKMYFGGILGFNAFYPNEIKPNLTQPAVVFTDFRLFNLHVKIDDQVSPLKKSISETDEIKLDYSQNLFSIEFAALEYTTPLHNQYTYKLEGFNEDWVQAGTAREATFTNLDPGSYVLRVRGANSDGIWSREEAVMMITVLPPFYMTIWFKLSTSLALLGAAVIAARYVIMRRVRERIIRSEQEAAMERERLRIARDLHDEIGSRLTEIRMISEMAKEKTVDESPITSDLEEISSASENLVTIFSEIVWSLNPQNDSLENLASFLGQCATNFLHKADIRCRLEFPDALPALNISSDIRHNLIMAVKESINNVVKHAEATIVNIKLEFMNGALTLLIRDDGHGFDLKNINQFGNGIKNIHRRIESIGGSISLKSEMGSGTSITISVPFTDITTA